MNTYQKLDPSRALALKILRKGWFCPRYILTDDQFEYGKLGSAGGSIFNRSRKIETAEGAFILKPLGWLAKETQIVNDRTGENVGTILRNSWDSKNNVTLNSGLTAVLAREGGIFSNKMSWANDTLGSFIQLKGCFSFSKAFTVTIDQHINDKPIPLALLSLVAANIILIRQAQAAAAS
jgi:hypothetical protein